MEMCLKGFFCISSATHDVQWLNCATVSCKIEVSHEKVERFWLLKSRKNKQGALLFETQECTGYSSVSNKRPSVYKFSDFFPSPGAYLDLQLIQFSFSKNLKIFFMITKVEHPCNWSFWPSHTRKLHKISPAAGWWLNISFV